MPLTHSSTSHVLDLIPTLVVWLNDAYSMERLLVRITESHIHDAKKLPELRARMEDHLNETRWHSQRIEECLAMLGEKPSFTRTAWNTLAGRIQGAALGPFYGDVTKNLLSDYATEHREIACYRTLIAAATEAGQLDIADICADILTQEEAMAQWLGEHISIVTRISLQHFLVRD